MNLLDLFDQLMAQNSLPVRVGLILGFAIMAHLFVILVRNIATRLVSDRYLQHQKARSVISLCLSAVIFIVYFLMIGLVLREFGVSLMAYLASASVIGLAVGFGSQGIVQDVVMGLTIVTTDLLDIGDLVDIGGQTGRVVRITMRFVIIQNALGATVYIPNRSIGNVLNYRRGYVRCIVDVTLTGEEETREKIVALTEKHMMGFFEQFRGIFLSKPSVEGRIRTDSGKEFLRLKFRIWPNRGQVIETVFPKELLPILRSADEAYQEWMIAVSYEVEERRN